jgi:hypothetical protein
VLKGATVILPETEMIILEAAFFTLGKDRPLFDTVIDSLREMGFLPYEFFDGLTRPLDGALASIDVAFAKMSGRFRKDQRWEAPEQAMGYKRRLVRAARQIAGVDTRGPSS